MIRLLILGAGDAGKMVAQEILNNERISSRFKIIGFIDDDKSKKMVLDLPVLGNLDHSINIIRQYNINEVIIAIPSASGEIINRIINILSKVQVRIKIVPGLYEIIEGKVSFKQIRNFEFSDLLGRDEIGFDTESIAPFYKGKTIFVTGGGGSIGSEIVIQLLELPIKKVICYGRGENSIHQLIQKTNSNDRLDYVIGNVKDFPKLKYEISRFQPDIIFHAAAHKHVPFMEEYPLEAVKNNIIGTYNCAIASANASVENFIFISTDKAVNPSSIMGQTKKIGENIVLSQNTSSNNTKFSIVRFGNVLGSRGSVVPIFRKQVEAGGPISITHPEMERFFMSIREAARLVIKSASVRIGNIFVLDMGKQIRILDLAKQIIKIYGYKEDDIPIIFTGIRPGEKLSEALFTKNENMEDTIFTKLFSLNDKKLVSTNNEIKKMLGEFSQLIELCNEKEIIHLLRKYSN